jgi:hypothetical protein
VGDIPQKHAGFTPCHTSLPAITLAACVFTGITIKTAKTAAKNIKMIGKAILRFLMANLLFQVYLMTGFLLLIIYAVFARESSFRSFFFCEGIQIDDTFIRFLFITGIAIGIKIIYTIPGSD